MQEGLLIKAYGGFYYVRAEGRTWELRARGRLRRAVPHRVPPRGYPAPGTRADTRLGGHPEGTGHLLEGAPVVGDRVLFMPVENGTGTLESILPRNNILLRPKVANVEQVIMVVPL